MAESLEYIFHHLFLPPKLPEEDDWSRANDGALLQCVITAVDQYISLVSNAAKISWQHCLRMLEELRNCRHSGGDLQPERLAQSLRELVEGGALVVHIRAQNAGIIVSRSATRYLFQSFELSPRNKDVISAQSRLVRSFPGPAVELDRDRVSDPHFQTQWAQLLARLDQEPVDEMRPFKRKAGSDVSEIRDTVHPAMVTELLMGMLRALGSPTSPARFAKHTREDVLWKDVCQPWHRSPLWLLLRVALQIHLMQPDVPNAPHVSYKSFMLFLLASLLENAHRHNLSPHCLKIMTAKISRRALKLDPTEDMPGQQFIEDQMVTVHEALAQHWTRLEANPDPDHHKQQEALMALSPMSDTVLSLQRLGPYLADASVRATVAVAEQGSIATSPVRVLLTETALSEFVFAEDNHDLMLLDLENWVRHSLDPWVSTHLQETGAGPQVARLMTEYISAASVTYKSNAEELSVMFLVASELWMALDRCTIHHFPLLAEYSPNIPVSVFEPLLLPHKSQMVRLKRLERYLLDRLATAVALNPAAASPYSSIFDAFNHASAFAVRYFNQSTRHQDLKRRIEADAHTRRDQRRQEMENKKEQYTQLMHEASALSCKIVLRQIKRKRQVPEHCPTCQKCSLVKQAKNLNVPVHEWPLPSEELAAQSAVVEMDLPRGVACWRDTTYSLLVDLFELGDNEAAQTTSGQWGLLDREDLKQYIKSASPRLQLVSTDKPWFKTHYKSRGILDATESSIIASHGSRYAWYDTRKNRETCYQRDFGVVRKRCTLPLSPRCDDELHFALGNTTHTSNEVLALQATCPVDMNLHEFYSLATLRAGARLQWRNIARELLHRTLDLNRAETHAFVAQAAWQTGARSPDGRLTRESHVDLEEEAFCLSLLDALDAATDTIRDNWQNASAVRTLTLLAARLLTLASTTIVQNRCYRSLRGLRTVALQWMRDLVQCVQNEHNQSLVPELGSRALELALTCHATYGVDEPELHRLLESQADMEAVLESAIVVHDRCPVVTHSLSAPMQMLISSHARRCHQLEPLLRRRILMLPASLDETIGRIWSAYEPGNSWRSLSGPNERWMMTIIASTSMHLHHNLLDGTLLINGVPLARLPRSYESHATFQRIFGQRILEVVPSTMECMLFELRTRLHGHRVSFAMSDGELIVRSEKDGRTYEVIPIHALEGDFPETFVTDIVHWLEPATGQIEWRPLESCWTPAPERNWTMARCKADGNRILQRGFFRLVDIHSKTAEAVASILRPLETSIHLHLTWHPGMGKLHVHLPRFSLDFEMEKNALFLTSRQFRGMRIDDDASIGTLTGLSSKLVLRQLHGHSRTILVPQGRVHCKANRNHVQVTISAERTDRRVTYHVYRVDEVLRRLVDNGRPGSTLFRCYLHAVTAYFLPDRLTGRTGTEEALAILASAPLRSSLRRTPEELELLHDIAALTPVRNFYPPFLCNMQTVKWHKVHTPLNQHPGFAAGVRSIRDHVAYMEIFHDERAQDEAWPDLDRGSPHLQLRAAHREAAFRVDGFATISPAVENDVTLSARDNPHASERANQVSNIAKLVDRWTSALGSDGKFLQTLALANATIIGRAQETKPSFTLGYDPRWLETPAKFLPENWTALQATLSTCNPEQDKYAVMVFLSTIAFGLHSTKDLAPMLLAFATVPELRMLSMPNHDVFRLQQGAQPDAVTVKRHIEEHVLPFNRCPEYHLPPEAGESDEGLRNRRSEEYEKAQAQSADIFVRQLTSQFPARSLVSPAIEVLRSYFDVEAATEEARPVFHTWLSNRHFLEYVNNVDAILNRSPPWTAAPQLDLLLGLPYYHRHRPGHVAMSELLAQPAPALKPTNTVLCAVSGAISLGDSNCDRLRLLLDCLRKDLPDEHEQAYCEHLERSFDALQATMQPMQRESGPFAEDFPRDYHRLCCEELCRIEETLLGHLRPMQTMALRLAHIARMTPRLSPVSLLQQLARGHIASLPLTWRRALVDYGVAITKVQHARRLQRAANTPADLLAERSSVGHIDWDPQQHPDWLLLELENDLLIRPRQIQIARVMMMPCSGKNAVMQLNMGEGKSSVIVPMVAAALADGTKLVRVIVLKPLAPQMFRALVTRLGGILGRQIFHLPTTRSQRLSLTQAQKINEVCKECMRSGGILLVQPEHLLSFELMGIERLLAGEIDLGQALVRTRRFLDLHSRDVLDESDEVLSVRFELIYTMGTQRDIENAPSRWVTVQHVLGMVRRMALSLHEAFPDGVELKNAAVGSFPGLRILNKVAGQALLERLTREISEFGVPGLAVVTLAPVKAALIDFLSNAVMSAAAMAPLRAQAGDMKSAWQCLLLLRGLIADGVLLFALQRKRWRVNYGLHLSRTQLAVPYRAKDVPAVRAEFSHPDMTIVLTCLSYYYRGLSDSELTVAFERLRLCDNGQEEYEIWVADAPKLPPQFCRLTGINLKDQDRCSSIIFPALFQAKGAIDYYLSQIVFPREMKEFPEKLSSSGWDIARVKTHATTGFSGTNDSRYVLPLSIEQRDLPSLQHTNALVLNYLLQPENELAVMPEQLDAASLLQMIVSATPPVRVLLDVGAQVLEWKNDEVAREWLLRQVDAQAAIYFDDDNELVVRDRDGRIESLWVSPWVEQIDQCVVYLDEAHTRGTDLKLPTDFRAAVLLGPHLTKDRLVQACMRMRRLGHGQSIMFCASPEITRDMSSLRRSDAELDVLDVLRWVIVGTCRHTKQSIPLWAIQGMRYLRQQALWLPHATEADPELSGEVAGRFLEEEAKSLEARYGQDSEHISQGGIKLDDRLALASRPQQVEAIRTRCQQFRLTLMSHAQLEEEQERELSPENEREQQNERPPAWDALPHIMHVDLVQLARTGRLPALSNGVQAAFQLMRQTSAGQDFKRGAWSDNVRTSVDFARTVKVPANNLLDLFLRPVHWILCWSQDQQVQLLIISPLEANSLLPLIRTNQRVTLHVYAARVASSGPSLEDLRFCPIPGPSTRCISLDDMIALNLFAGQLYLRNHAGYLALCRRLGLCFHPPPAHVHVAMDGFVDPAHRADFDNNMAQICRFPQSPVAYLRSLFAMRRHGQSIERSHLGRILQGEMLSPADLDSSRHDTEGHAN